MKQGAVARLREYLGVGVDALPPLRHLLRVPLVLPRQVFDLAVERRHVG
jgi:hypothetical protein